MSWLSDFLTGAIKVVSRYVPATTSLATIGGASVTAAQVETATASLATFFAALAAAIKARNLEAGVEVSLEEALTIAADLGLGEPFTGLAKALLPLLFSQINQLGDAVLSPAAGAAGGFVTQQWASDPREQLDPDGSFKN